MVITPREEHPIVAVDIYQENNCVRDVNPREERGWGGGGLPVFVRPLQSCEAE